MVIFIVFDGIMIYILYEGYMMYSLVDYIELCGFVYFLLYFVINV